MQELTERQLEVFDYICTYYQEHFYPPTFREIAKHCHMSLSIAHRHVIALVNKGYVDYIPRRSRTVCIKRR